MRAARDEFTADVHLASNGYAVIALGRARFLATRDELIAFALRLADVAETLGAGSGGASFDAPGPDDSPGV